MNLLLFETIAQTTVAPARSGAPLRVLAAILLVAMICGVIYLVRHFARVKREIIADDLVPAQRGPRNNMILVVCALTFVAFCLLLFLLVKA